MTPDELATRITQIRAAVATAAATADRDPDQITLVAVSKTVGREVVDAAYEHGLRHFGENRVQDARAKFATPLPADAALHLIGQLQSNKAKQAAALFDLIESVDRSSLVDALDKAARALGKPLRVLLQVNVAREPQKAGCAPEDLLALHRHALAAAHLTVVGLVTIAPLVPDPELARPVFAGLRRSRDELLAAEPGTPLPVLSMGMSNDYAVAVAEGATHLRIGRAVFGG
jgi:hypothetical protein